METKGYFKSWLAKNNPMELTKREKQNRLSLQEKKPLAFEKIKQFPEKIKRRESVALLQLQYNYSCNFKCKHCAIEKFKKLDQPTLSVDEVKGIADQADQMGLASICISGGEPLIFHDLEDVINAIGPKRFCISVDTNGYFLTEDKILWLVEKGVDRIHLSIDGLESNHSAFRGNKASWEKCINSLELCKEHGLGVIINIVATKSIIENREIIRQLEFIKRFKLHASMIYAKPVGSFEHYKKEILDSKDLEYIQSLTKKYNCSTHLSQNCGYEFGCLCVKRHFSITAYGDVLPCPWIPITIGNIRKEPLDKIIKRGLENPWFQYGRKYSCLSGNKDSYFYNKVLPQIERIGEYPAPAEKIFWGVV